MKKVWPQPGDLGWVAVTALPVPGPDYLILAKRDENGIPLMPAHTVYIAGRTPVIYVSTKHRGDIWFVNPGVYVQLIPDAQVTED